MTSTLLCWKCGASLDALPHPLSRLAECPACRTDLHICRMCEFYDPRISKQCREPIADEVKDKQRANFCGYFRIRPNAYQARDTATQSDARTQLEALFGEPATTQKTRSEAEATREQLEKLFGGDDTREKQKP